MKTAKKFICMVKDCWMEGDDYIAACVWPDGGWSLEKFERMPKLETWISI